MKEVKSPRKPLIYYYVIIMLAIMLINAFVMPRLMQRQIIEVPYSEFLKKLESGQISGSAGTAIKSCLQIALNRRSSTKPGSWKIPAWWIRCKRPA